MKKSQDPIVAEVRKVRRGLSARLLQARTEGRFMAELRAIEREGEKVLRDLTGRSRQARRRRQAP